MATPLTTNTSFDSVFDEYLRNISTDVPTYSDTTKAEYTTSPAVVASSLDYLTLKYSTLLYGSFSATVQPLLSKLIPLIKKESNQLSPTVRHFPAAATKFTFPLLKPTLVQLFKDAMYEGMASGFQEVALLNKKKSRVKKKSKLSFRRSFKGLLEFAKKSSKDFNKTLSRQEEIIRTIENFLTDYTNPTNYVVANRRIPQAEVTPEIIEEARNEISGRISQFRKGLDQITSQLQDPSTPDEIRLKSIINNTDFLTNLPHGDYALYAKGTPTPSADTVQERASLLDSLNSKRNELRLVENILIGKQELKAAQQTQRLFAKNSDEYRAEADNIARIKEEIADYQKAERARKKTSTTPTTPGTRRTSTPATSGATPNPNDPNNPIDEEDDTEVSSTYIKGKLTPEQIAARRTLGKRRIASKLSGSPEELEQIEQDLNNQNSQRVQDLQNRLATASDRAKPYITRQINNLLTNPPTYDPSETFIKREASRFISTEAGLTDYMAESAANLRATDIRERIRTLNEFYLTPEDQAKFFDTYLEQRAGKLSKNFSDSYSGYVRAGIERYLRTPDLNLRKLSDTSKEKNLIRYLAGESLSPSGKRVVKIPPEKMFESSEGHADILGRFQLRQLLKQAEKQTIEVFKDEPLREEINKVSNRLVALGTPQKGTSSTNSIQNQLVQLIKDKFELDPNVDEFGIDSDTIEGIEDLRSSKNAETQKDLKEYDELYKKYEELLDSDEGGTSGLISDARKRRSLAKTKREKLDANNEVRRLQSERVTAEKQLQQMEAALKNGTAFTRTKKGIKIDASKVKDPKTNITLQDLLAKYALDQGIDPTKLSTTDIKRLKENIDFTGKGQELGQSSAGSGNPYAQFERIASYEVSQAYNLGRVEAFRKAGIQKVQWISILDSRTSAYCRSLNGYIFTMDEVNRMTANPSLVGFPNTRKRWNDPINRFKGSGNIWFPAAHPYCRSYLQAIPLEEDIRDPIKDKLFSQLQKDLISATPTLALEEQNQKTTQYIQYWINKFITKKRSRADCLEFFNEEFQRGTIDLATLERAKVLINNRIPWKLGKNKKGESVVETRKSQLGKIYDIYKNIRQAHDDIASLAQTLTDPKQKEAAIEATKNPSKMRAFLTTGALVLTGGAATYALNQSKLSKAIADYVGTRIQDFYTEKAKEQAEEFIKREILAALRVSSTDDLLTELDLDFENRPSLRVQRTRMNTLLMALAQKSKLPIPQIAENLLRRPVSTGEILEALQNKTNILETTIENIFLEGLGFVPNSSLEISQSGGLIVFEIPGVTPALNTQRIINQQSSLNPLSTGKNLNNSLISAQSTLDKRIKASQKFLREMETTSGYSAEEIQQLKATLAKLENLKRLASFRIPKATKATPIRSNAGLDAVFDAIPQAQVLAEQTSQYVHNLRSETSSILQKANDLLFDVLPDGNQSLGFYQSQNQSELIKLLNSLKSNKSRLDDDFSSNLLDYPGVSAIASDIERNNLLLRDAGTGFDFVSDTRNAQLLFEDDLRSISEKMQKEIDMIESIVKPIRPSIFDLIPESSVEELIPIDAPNPPSSIPLYKTFE